MLLVDEVGVGHLVGVGIFKVYRALDGLLYCKSRGIKMVNSSRRYLHFRTQLVTTCAAGDRSVVVGHINNKFKRFSAIQLHPQLMAAQYLQWA